MLVTTVLVGVVTPVIIAVGATLSSTQVVEALVVRALPTESAIPEPEAFSVNT